MADESEIDGFNFESTEGYELEVTIRRRYKADPKNYIVADNGDDITAYELARIDAHNFHEDPMLLIGMLEDGSFDITVAPIVHID